MKVDPIRYGASFKSIANLAANTPETVFTPAANARGAIVHQANIIARAAGNNQGAGFLAKSSAPANVTDGDSICGIRSTGTTGADIGSGGWTEREIFIPAGKGLYYITNVADGAASRSVLYTLL